MGEPSGESEPGGPSTAGLVLGFGTIYVVWGSTYLAIRIAIETLPPFLMAGIRFLLAGAILIAWAKLRGSPLPSFKQWRTAVITGALMLLGGNGGVVWAEKVVPSGLAALTISMLPLWMALFDWLRPGGTRPVWTTWVGILGGFGGMAMLAAYGRDADNKSINLFGLAALIGANISWALGSIIAKHAPKPASPVMGAGAQMLLGGAWLLAASPLADDLAGFHPADVSSRSLLAMLYLLVFGSLLAMTAYNWLLHVTQPTLVATYAFVNPVIAVFLGAWLGGEALTRDTLLAGAVIVASVAWLIGVQWWRSRRRADLSCTRLAPRR